MTSPQKRNLIIRFPSNKDRIIEPGEKIELFGSFTADSRLQVVVKIHPSQTNSLVLTVISSSTGNIFIEFIAPDVEVFRKGQKMIITVRCIRMGEYQAVSKTYQYGLSQK